MLVCVSVRGVGACVVCVLVHMYWCVCWHSVCCVDVCVCICECVSVYVLVSGFDATQCLPFLLHILIT